MAVEYMFASKIVLYASTEIQHSRTYHIHESVKTVTFVVRPKFFGITGLSHKNNSKK